MHAPLTEADIQALYQALLRRPASEQDIRQLLRGGATLPTLAAQLRACDELRDRAREERQTEIGNTLRDPVHYRVPNELAVTELPLRRVLFVGSCLVHVWADQLGWSTPKTESDLYLNGADLPEQPAQPVGEYDFQVVGLALRSLIGDGAFSRLAQADRKGHEAMFDTAVGWLKLLFHASMKWNRAHGIMTFVMPFIVPQQNPVGRLLPRHDICNAVAFVERLNEVLEQETRACPNAYYFELNQIIATHGSRFVQEDPIGAFNHGGLFSNFDWVQDYEKRIEPVGKADEAYERRVVPLVNSTWAELLGMRRSLLKIDQVKLVVVDLDDTLWRGTIGDTPDAEMPNNEGWPRGLWEALNFLRRRGILLAIISRNDEARVMQAWRGIFHGILKPEDFVVRRINWETKSANMAEVLAQTALLAESTVFIDDNPVQRAEVAAAYPAIRMLGGNPIHWRHILLWAPETQGGAITGEAASRTELVRAQIVREEKRRVLSREDFLASLNVRMHMTRIVEPGHEQMPRVLELLNRTNQFNTTGERWTAAECDHALQNATRFFTFTLTDIHAEYGLVGVMITDRHSLLQFVMSCRVMGLEAERAAVAYVIALFKDRARPFVDARLLHTERNLPCRNLYPSCGFIQTPGGTWRRDTSPLAVPPHIRILGARSTVLTAG